MKVFVKVEALYDESAKHAVKPFIFDINSNSETLTIADIKAAVQDEFKRFDLTNSIVSEKVWIVGKDDHSDEVDVIALAGKNPNIKYSMILSAPTEVKARPASLAASSPIKKTGRSSISLSRKYDRNK